jgi:hypothetical protein
MTDITALYLNVGLKLPPWARPYLALLKFASALGIKVDPDAAVDRIMRYATITIC